MSLQLICINYGNLLDAVRVVQHCVLIMPVYTFDDVTILHPDGFEGINPSGEIAWMPNFYIRFFKAQSKTQNQCFTRELPNYITCDHAIGIQWDGFIIRPDLWDPSWLQYDWIAPPWPLQNIPNPAHRVGSGGFIMFSKRMSQLWQKTLDLESYNDWQIGATKRELFEKEGMKYAPVEVAEKFGREIPIEDSTVKEGESFGFHGFQYHEDREKWRKQLYE